MIQKDNINLLIIFEPYISDNALHYYHYLAKKIKRNFILLTFKKTKSNNRITVVRLTKSLFLKHTPSFCSIFKIRGLIKKTSVFISMFEIASPASFVFLILRKIWKLNFIFTSYSFENQTIKESLSLMKSTQKRFGVIDSCLMFLKRLTRYFVYEKILNPIRICRSSDIHFVASDITKKIYKIKRKKGLCIKSGYPVKIFNSRREKKDFGIYVGRLVKEKGVQDLIKVYNQFPQKKLVVIGEGPYKSELQKSVINKNIKFLGHKSSFATQNMISRAKILFCPSIEIPNWSEQFARVITEALRLNTFVVARVNKTLKNIYGNAIYYLSTFDKNMFKQINRKKLKKFKIDKKFENKICQLLTKNA